MSSRASQKRNTGQSAKVKTPSQGGSSFAGGNNPMSKTGGSGNGQLGPNIVIDIESESLTYNQARSIRLQLQRDVEQLRNRVRMLQNEEMRAIKKIDETRKKTRELQDLQNKNDNRVMRKQRDEQERQQKAEADREMMQRRKEKEKQQVLIRNRNFRDQKMAAVEEVRRQKEAMKHNLYGMREESYNQAQFRKQQIRQQAQVGLQKQNDFIKSKRANARHEVDVAAGQMTHQISSFEKESLELERLENELLRKLQETQVQERAAFQRLENAMVDGSIPPPMRAEQSVHQTSSPNIQGHDLAPNNGEDGGAIEPTGEE